MNNNQNSEDLDDCRNCGPSDFKDLGFVPLTAIKEVRDNSIEDEAWGNAFICTSCGDIRIKSIDQEDIDKTVNNLIDIYEEYELIAQEEIDSLKR